MSDNRSNGLYPFTHLGRERMWSKVSCLRDWSLFIGRGGGGGGGGLVQIGGGPPFFMHGLRGGGGIKKYVNVLPAKMLKDASGCHQQIQPIKITL